VHAGLPRPGPVIAVRDDLTGRAAFADGGGDQLTVGCWNPDDGTDGTVVSVPHPAAVAVEDVDAQAGRQELRHRRTEAQGACRWLLRIEPCGATRKFEIRSTKSETNSKQQETRQASKRLSPWVWCFSVPFRRLGFVSDFEFRAWDFRRTGPQVQ